MSTRTADRWPAVAASGQARRTARDPGALALALLFYALVSTVLATLWRGAAHARGGAVVGYSAVALTWYVTISKAVTVSLNQRLIEQIADDITGSAIAVDMLRPAPVLGRRVVSELGRSLPVSRAASRSVRCSPR